MKPTRHHLVLDHIFQSCKVERSRVDRETKQRVNLLVGGMHGAARMWEKPDQVEDQLENARAKLRDAIKAVEALDKFALVLARKDADRERDDQFLRSIEEIEAREISDAEKRELFERISADFKPQAVSDYVDKKAVASMAALFQSLERPTEQAIANAPQGRGRRKNRRAYAVAEYSLLIYREITGQDPGFWERGDTPFSRLVGGLFEIYGINADLKKPILAAMHKFQK